MPPGDQQPRVPTTPKAIYFPSGASSAEGKAARKGPGHPPRAGVVFVGKGSSGDVERLEGEGRGEGSGEAFGEAVDGGEEALEKGGDGEAAAEGLGADGQAVAQAFGAGAGGVDDPLDGA